MEQITVPSFRIALGKGKAVPGKPDLLIGKQIGTSLYTWNHIYEVKHIKDGRSSHQGQQQQQQQEEDANLAIKVGPKAATAHSQALCCFAQLFITKASSKSHGSSEGNYLS